MFARSSRRKASRVNYSEQGYEGDSDDEYDDSAVAGLSKRRKARTVSAAFPGESDDDAEYTTNRATLERRGRGMVAA